MLANLFSDRCRKVLLEPAYQNVLACVDKVVKTSSSVRGSLTPPEVGVISCASGVSLKVSPKCRLNVIYKLYVMCEGCVCVSDCAVIGDWPCDQGVPHLVS